MADIVEIIADNESVKRFGGLCKKQIESGPGGYDCLAESGN